MKTEMVDPKKFNPPPVVINARREAILHAIREAQAAQGETVKVTLDTPSGHPVRNFPIVLTTNTQTSR